PCGSWLRYRTVAGRNLHGYEDGLRLRLRLGFSGRRRAVDAIERTGDGGAGVSDIGRRGDLRDPVYSSDLDAVDLNPPHQRKCAVQGCPESAIWASSFVGPRGRTYLVPVCREHGREMSP